MVQYICEIRVNFQAESILTLRGKHVIKCFESISNRLFKDTLYYVESKVRYAYKILYNKFIPRPETLLFLNFIKLINIPVFTYTPFEFV